jgi:hypothetical protein
MAIQSIFAQKANENGNSDWLIHSLETGESENDYDACRWC